MEIEKLVTLKESHSVSFTILKAFLGWLYIGIPCFVLLLIFAFGEILAVLFLPIFYLISKDLVNRIELLLLRSVLFRIKFLASSFYMTTQYPIRFENGNDDKLLEGFEIDLNHNRLAGAFNSLLTIPHSIYAFIRLLMSSVLSSFAFWHILFAGCYPEGIFKINLKTLKIVASNHLFRLNLTNRYPLF